MTIKNRMFFSNIRIFLLTLGVFFLVIYIINFLVLGHGRPSKEEVERIINALNLYDLRAVRRLIWVFSFAFFMIILNVINSLFTHRMTKLIIKPLETLSEGVKQIQLNNFMYRIDYKNEDEFRPVCDAFNEMAAKLEASTIRQKKYETNRRELIAGISHDLRTPLTSVKGCIEGLQTGIVSTPEMKEKYYAIIKNKTEVMEHIIEQLYIFSRLDMDEFPLNLKRICLSLVLCDMIEEVLDEYSSRGLDIILSEIPKNIFVNADVIMLRNVIINILENSVKYKTKDVARMEINAAVEKNAVLLSLTDDGPGVSEKIVSKIFDVFYRSDPSRSKTGSGLGLAISAKIIERMGGSIHAGLAQAGGLSIVIKLPLLHGEALL